MPPLVFPSVEAARAAFALAPEGLEFTCSVCGETHCSDAPGGWFRCLDLLQDLVVSVARVRGLPPYPGLGIPPFWVTGVVREEWHRLFGELRELYHRNLWQRSFVLAEPCYLAVPLRRFLRHHSLRVQEWCLEALRRPPSTLLEDAARYRKMVLRLKRYVVPLRFPEVEVDCAAEPGKGILFVRRSPGEASTGAKDCQEGPQLCRFLLDAALGFSVTGHVRFARAQLPRSAAEWYVMPPFFVLWSLKTAPRSLRADSLVFLSYRRVPRVGRVFMRTVRLQFDWQAGRPRPSLVAEAVSGFPGSRELRLVRAEPSFRRVVRIAQASVTLERRRITRRVLRICRRERVLSGLLAMSGRVLPD